MTRTTLALFSSLVALGCASGPRPVPGNATADERLALCEAALLSAPRASGTFVVDATGVTTAHFAGTLELHGGNKLKLAAEGSLGGDLVFLDLDSRDPVGASRTVTKGPVASGHRDPPASAIAEALGVGLVRRGLLHQLETLTRDEPVDHSGGGVRDHVKTSAVRAGVIDSIGGETCHRVDFAVVVDGAHWGDASLCVADATGLPLHRTQTRRTETGTVNVTETFTWKLP